MPNSQPQYSQKASVIVENTTTETSLLGGTNQYNGNNSFSANTLGIGDVIILRAAGRYGGSMAGGTMRLSFYFANVVVSSSTITLPLQGGLHWWHCYAIVTCWNQTSNICGIFHVNDENDSPVVSVAGFPGGALDRTTANSVQLRVQFSVADADNELILHLASIEYLPSP